MGGKTHTIMYSSLERRVITWFLKNLVAVFCGSDYFMSVPWVLSWATLKLCILKCIYFSHMNVGGSLFWSRMSSLDPL